MQERQQGIPRLGALRSLLEGSHEAVGRSAAPHSRLDVVKGTSICIGDGSLEVWVSCCCLCKLGKQILLTPLTMTRLNSAL